MNNTENQPNNTSETNNKFTARKIVAGLAATAALGAGGALVANTIDSAPKNNDGISTVTPNTGAVTPGIEGTKFDTIAGTVLVEKPQPKPAEEVPAPSQDTETTTSTSQEESSEPNKDKKDKPRINLGNDVVVIQNPTETPQPTAEPSPSEFTDVVPTDEGTVIINEPPVSPTPPQQ